MYLAIYKSGIMYIRNGIVTLHIINTHKFLIYWEEGSKNTFSILTMIWLGGWCHVSFRTAQLIIIEHTKIMTCMNFDLNNNELTFIMLFISVSVVQIWYMQKYGFFFYIYSVNIVSVSYMDYPIWNAFNWWLHF